MRRGGSFAGVGEAGFSYAPRGIFGLDLVVGWGKALEMPDFDRTSSRYEIVYE